MNENTRKDIERVARGRLSGGIRVKLLEVGKGAPEWQVVMVAIGLE